MKQNYQCHNKMMLRCEYQRQNIKKTFKKEKKTYVRICQFILKKWK